MSIVGIDFGSHSSSVAIWFEEKNTVEVLADDLGSRTIPSVVAFRGDEIITGEAAVSQMHKNASNTFDDVKSRLLNVNIVNINVPLLDKDLTVQELSSHFFRNIHNQIKQQVGKAVRDCVVSVPKTLDESVRKRLVEAAQAGGMRIKACLDDSVCALMAHRQDEAGQALTRTLVVDIGWGKSTISLFNVSGGLIFPVASEIVQEAGASTFVNLVVAHCAKDFTRKYKVPVEESKRSMMRLRRECENAMRSLSTGAEATIDIDSLCEGIDYSFKLSRARFEDLITIPFMHLKNAINKTLGGAGWSAETVQQVCMTGGGSAIPRAVANMKSMFPSARFLVGKFEVAETQCIGACLHGKFLFEQGLIENAPAAAPLASCTTRALRLAGSDSTESSEIVPVHSVLPLRVEVKASLPAGQNKGYMQIIASPSEPVDAVTILGELVFELVERSNTDGDEALVVSLAISEEGEVTVEATQTSTKLVLASLTIPAASA